MIVLTLARKPLVGSVASNVLKYGTGGINIDGCRISTSDNLNGGAYSGGVRPGSAMGCVGEVGGTSSFLEAGGGRLSPLDFKQPPGRFPANLIFQHLPECKCLGVKEVKGITGTLNGAWRKGHQYEGGYTGADSALLGSPVGYANPDGKETVADWDCQLGCPVEALDEQSGVCKSGFMKAETQRSTTSGYHGGFPQDRVGERDTYGDSGGASRFFKQVQR